MAIVALLNTERAQALVNLLLRGELAKANARLIVRDDNHSGEEPTLIVLGNPQTLTSKYGDAQVPGEFLLECERYCVPNTDEYRVLDQGIFAYQYGCGRLSITLEPGEDLLLSRMIDRLGEEDRIIEA